MRHLTLPVQLTCLSLAICTQLYAQNTVLDSGDHSQPQQSAKLATIVMTATRSPQNISDIAGTVYSISREDIAKQSSAGKATAEILSTLIPSLTASSGTTSNYGMTMRGRVVQYMIDGVPQTGYRDLSRQLNSISPAMIERVEVVSGASSIYGSGATGGIINIITRRGSEKPLSFETTVGISSGHQLKSDALAYEVSQLVSFNQADLQGSFGGSYAKRGEFQDSHGKRIGPEVAQTDRQDTQTLDLHGRLAWNIADGQNLSFGAQYYHDEQDSDYGPDYGKNLAVLLAGEAPSLKAVKGLQLDDQPLTQRYATNIQYENQHIWGQTLNAEAYYRSETARFYPSVNGFVHPQLQTYLVNQSESDMQVWGARLALQKQFIFSDDRTLGFTYGVDYENEKDSAQVQRYDLTRFMQSNGLGFTALNQYEFGPEVKTAKLGIFAQTNFNLTNRLGLQAGIRHEAVESDVSTSTPYSEAITADDVPTYQAQTLQGAKVKHDATLLNVGAVYHLTDAQQVFANFSQGANLPDVQRMLRDMPAGFKIDNQSIDPIKVNSYELGWRTQSADGLNAGISVFYNNSDKSIKFGRPNYTIDVLDTDERVYGAEAHMHYNLQSDWTVGGTLAYTRGQFKNATGDWQELDAIRIAPLKGTLYSDWKFDNDMSLRMQVLAIGGTDKAAKDAQQYGSTVPAQIQGFATMDVIANAKVGAGSASFGVYNLWNSDYKSVYSQSVASVYGPISSLPAQGRTYGLSYTLHY